jgi:hypothetical protein
LAKIKKITSLLSRAARKAEAPDWVYFKHTCKCGFGLFKSRPNGSERTQFAIPKEGHWIKLGNITTRGDWVYFDVTENYSVFDEEYRKFNRCCDEVTYKIMKTGENLTRV